MSAGPLAPLAEYLATSYEPDPGNSLPLPDVSVVVRPPKTRFLREAAHMAIEILSENDRMIQVLEELAEYEVADVTSG